MDPIVMEFYLRKAGITLDRFHRDEEGQGLVEYVLIIALIAIIAIVAVRLLGSRVSGTFDATSGALEEALTPVATP